MAKRRTTEEFIALAKQTHGNLYDYSKVEYINKDIKVTITCPYHGDFEQIPHNHLRGATCKLCSIPIATAKSSHTQLLTTEQFIEKAKRVHLNKYNYSKVNYTGMKNKVDIICLEHGEFSQRAFAHVRGDNCPKCARKALDTSNTLTQSEFLLKAHKAHKLRYTYANCLYTGMRNLLTVTCRIHGDFTLRAQDFLSGSGCQICGNICSTSHYLDEPTILYFLYFPEYNIYKLGITIARRGIRQRYLQDKIKYKVLYEKEFLSGKEAYVREQYLLSNYKHLKYFGPPILIGGNSELFTSSIIKELQNDKHRTNDT